MRQEVPLRNAEAAPETEDGDLLALPGAMMLTSFAMVAVVGSTTGAAVAPTVTAWVTKARAVAQLPASPFELAAAPTPVPPGFVAAPPGVENAPDTPALP
jgi:hypothetical protein